MKTSPRRLITISAFCLTALLAAPVSWAGDSAQLAEGQAAFNAGDYQLAFAKWSELATTGHAEAQVFIGLSYANGWGVEKNPALASVWYQKAAKNENPSAQFLLGIQYISSSDKLETATGLMWLRRAAANGDDSARRFLARARARGWFKDQEAPKGLKPPSTTTVSSAEETLAIASSSASGDHTSPSEDGHGEP